MSFINFSETRIALAKKKGVEIDLKCKHCSAENKYHVNEIYAKQSKIILVLSFTIFLLGTLVIGYLLFSNFWLLRKGYSALYLGSFLLVPVFIYTVMNKNERSRVNVFNKQNY